MFRLACVVNAGIFSSERLIRFAVADGNEYTALVDSSLVHSDGPDSWVSVRKTADAEGRSLVALPSDGARVWVASDLLSPA